MTLIYLAFLLPSAAWAGSDGGGPTPARARYQVMAAAWAAARGDAQGAAEAARLARVHDPAGAMPRLIEAQSLAGDPEEAGVRLQLLEEATRDPGAAAAVFTALGQARVSAGHAEAAPAAFAAAEARGAGSANYDAWLRALDRLGRTSEILPVYSRWASLRDPGPGGYALRAAWTPLRPEDAARACDDASAAARLGEAIDERLVVARCTAVGRDAEAAAALASRP